MVSWAAQKKSPMLSPKHSPAGLVDLNPSYVS